MLRVDGLEAAYGASQVLFGIDLAVGAGEVVTLLGRNGMGKTTTIRTILGLLAPRAGTIEFGGTALRGQAPERIARLGIGLVPEGRRIFPTLTVRENLVATASSGADRVGRWTLPRIYGLFPRLEERAGQRAGTLSGGEQQMLAIGRALMTNPRLLILDEATEGLAPLIRAEIWRCLAHLKNEGEAILVVDKNLAALKRLADRHVIVEKGRTVWQGNTAELDAAPETVARHLGV
jgi:branched-chain amino acid transport system ATP-binding protein